MSLHLKITKADNAKSVITQRGAKFKVKFQLEKYTTNKAGNKVIKNELIGYFCKDGEFLDLKELASINWIDLSDTKEKSKPVYCIDIQEHSLDYLLESPVTYENYMRGKYYDETNEKGA